MATSIPVVKLTARNFPEWTIQMEAYLVFQGWSDCITPIDDLLDEDGDLDDSTERRSQYRRNDPKARAAMILSMDPASALQYHGVPTAAKLWAVLQKMHNDSSSANYHKLMDALINLHMEQNEPLATYVGRASVIQDSLRSAGREKTEEEISIFILQGRQSRSF